jgi:hypothetical protein
MMYRCNRCAQIFYTLHPQLFLANFAHPLCSLRFKIVTNILLIKKLKTFLLQRTTHKKQEFVIKIKNTKT